MTNLRKTLLGACLALPLFAATGQAQDVQHGSRTIYLPPGAVVLILPGPGEAVPARAGVPRAAVPAAEVLPMGRAMPAAMPMMRLIAEQQAAMQQMMVGMNALFPPMPPVPDPSQLIRAAFGAGGPMLQLASGPGMCSESISIVQHGDAAPVITRSETGGACGLPGTSTRPRSATQIRPVPPPMPAHGPRVLDVSDPAQPISATPRT